MLAPDMPTVDSATSKLLKSCEALQLIDLQIDFEHWAFEHSPFCKPFSLLSLSATKKRQTCITLIKKLEHVERYSTVQPSKHAETI